MPVGIITAVGTIAGGSALGIGGGLIGALETAGLGAALGAGTSAAFGRDPGKGALFGGLGGVGQALGPVIGQTLGLSGDVGNVIGTGLADSAAGAIGAGITGGNVGKSALFGGLEGVGSSLISNALSSSGNTTQPSGAAGGGVGAGAGAGQAAPSIGTSSTLPADVIAPGSAGVGSPAFSPTGTAPALSGPSLDTGSAGVGSPTFSPVGGGGIQEMTVPGVRTPGGGLSTGNALAGTAGALGGTQLFGGSGNITAPAFTPSSTSQPTTGLQTTAAGGPPAAKVPTSGQTFLHDPTLANFGKVLTSNPGTVLGLGGLAFEAANQPSLPDTSALIGDIKSQADVLSAQGKNLMSFINNGQLPPGAQAIVTNATNAAKATLKSKFAAMGLSGSSQEATALAQADQQAAGQVFQIANDLLNTGIKESGLSATIYEQILGESTKQNELLSNSIANFAASMAGGGARGLTLNVGGST